MYIHIFVTHIRSWRSWPGVWRWPRGSQGMGVVSNNRLDRVWLLTLYMFKPPCWPTFKPPSLGPPKFPLKLLAKGRATWISTVAVSSIYLSVCLPTHPSIMLPKAPNAPLPETCNFCACKGTCLRARFRETL